MYNFNCYFYLTFCYCGNQMKILKKNAFFNLYDFLSKIICSFSFDHYSIIGYKTRNILAAIDCNKHLHRPQQVGPNGKPM